MNAPQPAEPVGHDAATVQAFLDQARALADWHRQRADSFETKASTVIGFSGVVLTLLTLTAEPIGDVTGSWRTPLVALVAVSAATFLGAAVAAVFVMKPRGYRYASREQLRKEWGAIPGRPTAVNSAGPRDVRRPADLRRRAESHRHARS